MQHQELRSSNWYNKAILQLGQVMARTKETSGYVVFVALKVHSSISQWELLDAEIPLELRGELTTHHCLFSKSLGTGRKDFPLQSSSGKQEEIGG